ncbi:hypothetical protein ACKKBG_A11075 [Auxenochlorella protothecoides x Auxenochlorella symbiontica]
MRGRVRALHRKLSRQYEEDRREEACAVKEANRAALDAALQGLRAVQAARMEGKPPMTIPMLGSGEDWPAVGTTGYRKLIPAGKEMILNSKPPLMSVSFHPCWTIPSKPPLPPYKGWSFTRNNTPATVIGRRLFYTDKLGETVPVSDNEEDPDVLAAVKLAGPQRPKHDYILAHIAEELGESQDVAAALSGVMQIPAPLLQQRMKELVRPARRAGAGAAAAPAQPPAPDRLRRSLQGAWCRQCRTYACRLHAAAPLPVAGPMAPRWADGGNGAASPAPCGPSCVRASEDGQGAGPAQAAPGAEGTLGPAGPGIQGAGAPPVPTQGVALGPPAWSEWEAGLLAEGVRVWGCGNPCALASMIGTRSCAEVAAEVARRFPGATHGSPTKPPAYHRRKPAWGKRIRPTVTQDRLRRTDPLWAPWRPCSCVGPCVRGTCPCVDSQNFCEKFCACDCRACGNRFPGCKCSARARGGGRCRVRTCACLAAGRECDPDLCAGCQPSLAAGSEGGDGDCANFRLRRGTKKRVLMGLSDVQGWGAFLQGSARAGDFLGEYVGELVDTAEADRRGISYDRDDNSYLFSLNKASVVDAKTKGTKLRFANHSSDANCEASILMVDGDHRVAILARKNIRDGDELFYNYHYEKRAAPSWWNLPPAQGSGLGQRRSTQGQSVQ